MSEQHAVVDNVVVTVHPDDLLESVIAWEVSEKHTRFKNVQKRKINKVYHPM